jgi:hypothetical protein
MNAVEIEEAVSKLAEGPFNMGSPLERIHNDQHFDKDAERLEKLFELYAIMAASAPSREPGQKVARRTKGARA